MTYFCNKMLEFDIKMFSSSADFEQFVATGLPAAAAVRGKGHDSQPETILKWKLRGYAAALHTRHTR
jgi:hypothetical protein